MTNIMTPSGRLNAVVNDDLEYPGIHVKLGSETVAIIEWTKDDGIRTLSYKDEEDDPLIVTFGK